MKIFHITFEFSCNALYLELRSSLIEFFPLRLKYGSNEFFLHEADFKSESFFSKLSDASGKSHQEICFSCNFFQVTRFDQFYFSWRWIDCKTQRQEGSTRRIVATTKGLTPVYVNSGDYRKLVRSLAALSLLPVQDVPYANDLLLEEVGRLDLSEYVGQPQTQSMRSRSQNRIDPSSVFGYFQRLARNKSYKNKLSILETTLRAKMDDLPYFHQRLGIILKPRLGENLAGQIMPKKVSTKNSTNAFLEPVHLFPKWLQYLNLKTWLAQKSSVPTYLIQQNRLLFINETQRMSLTTWQ